MDAAKMEQSQAEMFAILDAIRLQMIHECAHRKSTGSDNQQGINDISADANFFRKSVGSKMLTYHSH